MSLRSRTLPSSSGPNERHRRPDVRALLARQRQDLDGVALRHEGELERLDPRGDGRVRRVARRADAGEVALDVDGEHGHPERAQLAREELERLRLAGARGPGDQPVAVDPRQRHLDPDLGQHLVAEDRRAEHDDRLVEGVAGRHLGAERVVHAVPPVCPDLVCDGSG